MKEVLIGLMVIGLFLFCYFIVDRLGRFLETTELCQAADQTVCASTSDAPAMTEASERADDPGKNPFAGLLRYQYHI